MRKLMASRVFRLCTNVFFFVATVAGLFATYFWLAIPIMVISLLVAIFSKSKQLKEIVMSCLFAFLAVFLAFWVQAIIKH